MLVGQYLEPHDVVSGVQRDPNDELADDGFEEVRDPDAGKHERNIASELTEKERLTIAQDLTTKIQLDIESRSGWYQKVKTGLELLGLSLDADVPEFEGALEARYPLLRQALVQFNARTMDEIFPPEGPVKTKVRGERTQDKLAAAKRVLEYMNYQIVEVDPTWYNEDDRMTMHLAMYGHGFKRVHRDRKRNVSRFLNPRNVIIPYDATSLEDSPRVTHEMRLTALKVRRLTNAGVFLDVDLGQPPMDTPDEIKAGIDNTESATPQKHPDDHTYTMYRVYTDLTLASDAQTGMDNTPLPYEVYFDKASQQVLGIYRAWDEMDDEYHRETDLVDYVFVPGFGYYGLGYLHLIGDLDHAATDLMRTIADGGRFASMQGGFATKDLNNGKGVAMEVQPGVWTPIECTSEELAKGLYTPTFREPSQALFATLQLMIDSGKEFASLTEANVGSAASTGPVGTMVALVEQSGKVYSGIHKRIHQAKRREYKLLAQLSAQHIPENGYPYEVANEARMVYAEDFSDSVSIVPVSDPNITSPQQRIALAEAFLALAERFPQIYDVYEVNRRMLEAMRAPEIDRILKNPAELPSYDPVTENMGFLVGQSSVAEQTQDHGSHITVHTTFLQSPTMAHLMQLNPEMYQTVLMGITVHIIEHHAFAYQQQVLGEANLPVQLHPPTGEKMSELPPELEAQIAQMAAQSAQQATGGELQPPEQPKSPEQIEAESTAQMAQAEHEQELEHKQQQHEQEMAHRDAEARQKLEAADALAQIKLDAERERAKQQVMNSAKRDS